MGELTLWTIGSRDGRSADLFDNFKEPNALGDVLWQVGASERQQWPLFHPSEADPDAGYRPHPFTVTFLLDDEPRGAFRLTIHYLVIAPRLSQIEIEINGVRGTAFLRPSPSRTGEIRIHAGLHTTIYADGVVDVVIPAHLLRQDINRLTMIARDCGEVIRVERIEAIRRLDRMANSAGFIYQWIVFAHQQVASEGVLDRIDIRPSVVYTTGPDGKPREQCHLFLEYAHGADPACLTLELQDSTVSQRVDVDTPNVALGHVHLPFDLVDGAGPVRFTLSGSIAGEYIECAGRFDRKRKWTVYVAPHVHTDIGYTHRQWEVAERLCRTVDAALDLMTRPENAKSFAYHLDSTWALETYLQSRRAARGRQLMDQVRAGRFGVPGGYVDLLTQLAALEDLIRNGEIAQALLRPEGLRTDFSSIVDVASLSGSLPAVLEGCGIRYLVHANNQDRGPFRLLGGLHRRSPYYWESVSGGRVLVWLSKMYCELRKVCGSPPVLSSAERGLDLWLDEYERDDYEPDAVLLYGQEADNTDLDPQPVDFVREWNRAYAFPRLIPSAVGDFFRDVESRFADSFPVIRGDGGAYWEDGAGSSLRATARIRNAQGMLPAAEMLEALAVIHAADWAYPLDAFDEAWRQLLLADEHTWGAFLSGPEPDALLARDQWATKMEMVEAAARWSNRLLHVGATRHSLSWNTDGREVVVYNAHSWPVSGSATVEIGATERIVNPDTGDDAPMRRLSATASQAVVEFWVDELPGLS
ncbi:MAG: polysaccharide lyase family protein, partial [Thermomicrobiales bacterium]